MECCLCCLWQSVSSFCSSSMVILRSVNRWGNLNISNTKRLVSLRQFVLYMPRVRRTCVHWVWRRNNGVAYILQWCSVDGGIEEEKECLWVHDHESAVQQRLLALVPLHSDVNILWIRCSFEAGLWKGNIVRCRPAGSLNEDKRFK